MIPSTLWGVTSSKVSALVQGYIRGPGPWYRSPLDFTCIREPNSWFATPEGSRRAAMQSADVWVGLLKENQVKLSILLDRIQAPTEVDALSRGQEVFTSWLRSIEEEWRASAPERARKEEWNYYLQETLSSGQCDPDSKKGTLKTAPPSKELMEPVKGSTPSSLSILARAPVRLWNGLDSIRLSVKAAGKTLNGRFLVDSRVNQSVISPSWLENQGVYPVWIEVPRAPLVSVFGKGLWKEQRQLGRKARVDGVEISGLDLPLTDFVLLQTDFFEPPETVGHCCDGVLGNDFLRLYPIEFRRGPPPEMMIWPRENFVGPPGSSWVEIRTSDSGIASVEGGTSKVLPSDSVTFDLPHGRLWFSNGVPLGANQAKRELQKNRSGLKLVYVFQAGERVLRVSEIQSKSPAQKLSDAGLRPGMIITSIDSVPAGDLDTWEMQRRLNGEFGSTVVLQWKTKKGLKMAPLKVQRAETL